MEEDSGKVLFKSRCIRAKNFTGLVKQQKPKTNKGTKLYRTHLLLTGFVAVQEQNRHYSEGTITHRQTHGMRTGNPASGLSSLGSCMSKAKSIQQAPRTCQPISQGYRAGTAGMGSSHLSHRLVRCSSLASACN